MPALFYYATRGTLSRFHPRPEKVLWILMDSSIIGIGDKSTQGSGNWPMDDVAIEKTKSAFLLRIGESLQNNWGMICIATEENVDVFFFYVWICISS